MLKILTRNLMIKKLLQIKSRKNSKKKKNNCQSKLINYQNSKKNTKSKPKKPVNN